MSVSDLHPDLRSGMSWEELDAVLQRHGIHHGVPIGLGEAEIDGSPQMNRLLQAMGLMERSAEPETYTDENGKTWRIRNSWHTEGVYRGRYGIVNVLEDPETGRVRGGIEPYHPAALRFNLFIETGAQRRAFTLSTAEITAQNRLLEALNDQQRGSYLMLDTFVERGRSGVLYFVRKNRPTIACRSRPDGGATPLCALCLHPLGYYVGTWAGVMPPSDEVLTHLLYIRSDEHFFWRKANQIPLTCVMSGL